ncbi:MAG: adenylyltransferase/cytidyltransferase family protein [Clostridia bacterium]|nr:adenylyltransferase/cytidyltransferase family protein [Clostridia bacterium]
MTIFSLPAGDAVEKLPTGAVVALGYFDGVHLGHRAIIDTARREAEERGACSAVWMISSRDGGYKKDSLEITDEAEKYALLYGAGAKYAVVHAFPEVRGLTGEEFVRLVLKDELGVSCVVCGKNFRFGKGASMDSDALRMLCRDAGIDTVVVSHVTDEFGETVSSTKIRRLIADGEVEAADLMLGRPYSFTSPVLEGKRLGRTIGFPTINQIPKQGRLLPKNGVYAVCVEFFEGGMRKTYAGAANVGVCPTVSADVTDTVLTKEGVACAERRVCETYIADYEGELYGRCVTLRFLRRLRDEVAFSDISRLKEQISRDAAAAVQIYNEIYGKQ